MRPVEELSVEIPNINFGWKRACSLVLQKVVMAWMDNLKIIGMLSPKKNVFRKDTVNNTSRRGIKLKAKPKKYPKFQKSSLQSPIYKRIPNKKLFVDVGSLLRL